jgi:hypothetical protein
MDISRLKKKDLRAWLPLVEGVEVLCRFLNQSEIDLLRKEATEIRMDPKDGKRIEARDEKKFLSLLGRAVVSDWRGMCDGDQDFPCTPENVDFLMDEYGEFRMLVVTVPNSFERMIAVEKAQTEKNLETTSAPELTTPE